MNILAIDIGNTSAKAGFFVDGELGCVVAVPLPGNSFDVDALPADALAGPRPVVVISSVNPRAADDAERKLCKFSGAEVLRLRRDVPISAACLTENPAQTGDDRLANAVAAHHIAHGSAIVIDVGTAITIDAVAESGAFMGGAIAPGLGTSARALHEFTRLLPLIEPHPPGNAIARNTTDAMNVGIVTGLAGLVDRLVDVIAGELGGDPMVIATGGHASLLTPLSNRITRVEKHLTLLGIKLIYEAHVS